MFTIHRLHMFKPSNDKHANNEGHQNCWFKHKVTCPAFFTKCYHSISEYIRPWPWNLVRRAVQHWFRWIRCFDCWPKTRYAYSQRESKILRSVCSFDKSTLKQKQSDWFRIKYHLFLILVNCYSSWYVNTIMTIINMK